MGNGNTSFIQSHIGNPFFATNNNEDSEVEKIMSEYRMVSVIEDNLFKKCSIIEHKTTHQLMIVKEISCQSQQDMNIKYIQFQDRKSKLTDDNLIRLRYMMKRKSDGMFRDDYKLILFFDYVLINMLDEQHNRLRNNLQFTPEEILIIMSGSIRGYAALEQLNYPNNNVRTKNVYFGLKEKQPYVKVIDSKLLPNSATNVEFIRHHTKDIDDIFLSPQELKSIHHPNIFTNQYQKSGVFSLGLVLMELCLIIPSKELYDYENLTINYIEMETRLNIIKNKYPLTIYYIIKEMTQVNHNLRPSFITLKSNLASNIKDLSLRMTLSIVLGESMPHINNQSKYSRALPQSGHFSKSFNSSSFNPGSIHPSEKKLHISTLLSNSKPNMEVSEAYTNGNMYTGQKKDNQKHGKGKYVYSDGSYYYGDWFKGKMEGHGQLFNANGDLQYQGEWKDDLYNGRGVLKNKGEGNWNKYEGEFANGRMCGFGQMYFKNGDLYKGEMRADMPWGKGTMIFANGSAENGYWEKGVKK